MAPRAAPRSNQRKVSRFKLSFLVVLFIVIPSLVEVGILREKTRKPEAFGITLDFPPRFCYLLGRAGFRQARDSPENDSRDLVHTRSLCYFWGELPEKEVWLCAAPEE